MNNKHSWIYDILFILVLLVAGYLRIAGYNWGEGQHQHPDELFLTGVLDNLRAKTCVDENVSIDFCPTDQQRWMTIGEYFDSSTSTLSPYNRGHGFFVYGNLPMTLTRVVYEIFNADAPVNSKFLARQFSAIADLLTVFILYLIASKLYGRKIGLLAATFSSLAVLQIQQSHFFTADTFVNMFMFLTLWFGVSIVAKRVENREQLSEGSQQKADGTTPSFIFHYSLSIIRSPLFLLTLGFGFALGMAMASKINAAAMAIVLPFAFFVRYLIYDRQPSTTNQQLSTDYWQLIIALLIAGGLATLISFRIFQPYAFDGFGLSSQWLSNLSELRAQAKGTADLPWNLQWARRSHLFSFENLTVWGLGLPLGILAWIGFAIMAWRIFKHKEYQHLLLWGWTAFYFTWQSLQFNATMRYQLPIYPLLCMMAGWVIFESCITDNASRKTYSVIRNVIGFAVLILTVIWAFAFQGIYLRDETRIAASRWFFQNAPAGINLSIESDEGQYTQPLPVPSGLLITNETPYTFNFTPRQAGTLNEITFGAATDSSGLSTNINLTLYFATQPELGLASGSAILESSPAINSAGFPLTLAFDQQVSVFPDQQYVLKLETSGSGLYLSNFPSVFIQTIDGSYTQELPIPQNLFITSGNPYILTFTPQQEGNLQNVTFGFIKESSGLLPTAIDLTVYAASQPDADLAHVSSTLDSSSTSAQHGAPLTLKLDRAVPLLTDQQYILKIETTGADVSITGSAIANETGYDFSLPFRVDGYDPYGGLYSNEDLVLEVYWPDDANKINRFVEILSKADYIAIPTNHQYGQITRLPERYPLTTLYYRELIGCPDDEEIIECYRIAKPDTYQGNLGFDLVAVFESYPTFGNIVINDQAAEEAFTFYDHPKVMIFQKNAEFDANQVRAILNTVDLTKVVQLTPTQFDDYQPQKTLMLPEAQLATQRAGGTWSELFDYDWLQNKYPWLGVLYWYAFIFLLGVFAYPIARLALTGLKQYSYPFGRIVGILLLAWLAWFGGSIGIDYTRISIGVAFVIVAGTGITVGLKRKHEIKAEWNSNRKFFIAAEIVFLSFFLIDLFIRVGNPDLWHQFKGGERPMDFSYLNAVLKSTSFPAYDPWFAGGYINYYYYGFVLAGTPIKLLGIVPTIAYNFLLPTWFALIAVGTFAIGFSLVSSLKSQVNDDNEPSTFDLRLISGIGASVMAILLGNLGTIQFIINSIQRVALQGAGVPADSTFFQRIGWTFQGLWKMFGEHATLPIGRGDWYWNPSRVIPPGPGNEITEFPLFTFLYSDLHAHMLVMPIAIFIIAWALAVVLSRAQLTRAEWIISFFIGALAIGALKPTNTWDLYTYYLLAAIAMGYTIYRYLQVPSPFKSWVVGEGIFIKLILAVGSAILLYFISSLLYYPFTYWWGQAYNSIAYWSASRTPFGSYFTQWGLFLFIITAWLIWETREWMAVTSVSKLSGLKKYILVIEIIVAGFIALLAFFLFDGVFAGLIALPLALWSAILILRPELPDTKRFVLFLTGTALTITIAVEFISLVGDIGRMNTIFKLYLQAWMMFAISAAAALAWLLPVMFTWKAKWRNLFQVGFYLLLSSAFLFTLTGTTDKISDRLNPNAPHSLDSMEYMNHSELWDGQTMNLSEDYRAIRWMQDNVQGSPVIVEANCTEYRWCTRFTINTGLPGVVGWNWHQRQQRGVFAQQVQDRVNEVGLFYNTTDIQLALAFLKKYDVQYIVVGQLERNVYPTLIDLPDGLAKFKEYNGVHWKAVYEDLNTTIYEVIP